jgi:hypothetical protein
MSDLFDLTKNIVMHEVKLPIWLIFTALISVFTSSFILVLFIKHGGKSQ